MFKTLMKVTALTVMVTFLFMGCETLGIGKPDQTTRWIADIGCITAATSAGLSIAADPMVGGAKTAAGVLAAILSVGLSGVPSTVLTACKDTLAWATQDAKGAFNAVTGATGSSAPTVQPQAPTGVRPPAQPKQVTPVVVPLPKK